MPEHRHLQEVESTNDVARKALMVGAPAGSSYRADRQTAGRGRQGRTWISGAGDLTMSVILRPVIAAELIPSTTLAVGVAVQKTLAQLGVSGRLKWPNDLLVGDRKIGGILVEGVYEGSEWLGCIVGLGINVALDVSTLPEPLQRDATSFAREGLPAPDLDELARELARAIVRETARVEDGHLADVLVDWRALNVTLGRHISYERDGQRRTGVAIDVNSHGALIVDEVNPPQRVVVQSGEVRFVRHEADSDTGPA